MMVTPVPTIADYSSIMIFMREVEDRLLVGELCGISAVNKFENSRAAQHT